ncbi:MAG: branched-chain amino acid ABC transporter permease [Alphaproteobacteria bacterium]
MFDQVIELLLLAIIVGGIYALFSVGITLIFGVLDIINVAHGEFFAIGAYVALVPVALFGLGSPVGVIAGTLGAVLLGALIYPVIIRPIKARLGRRAPGPMFLVVTLGLSIFLQNSLLAAAGGEYLRLPPQVRGGLDLPFMYLSHQRILIFLLSSSTLLGLYFFLRYHRQGLAIRAVAMNPTAAQAVGIPLGHVFTLTIALGCGLAGLAGTIIAPLINVYPSMGFALTIKAFAITILGGMGNVTGALIASFVIAIIESLSVLVLPSAWQDAVAFSVMMLVLLLRPTGILAGARK